MVISYLFSQLQGQDDILGLSALVATAEQDDQKTRVLHIIDPVSGAVVDTKLADALAHRHDVAGIAERQAANPTGDLGLGASVSQAREPFREGPGLANFNHL